MGGQVLAPPTLLDPQKRSKLLAYLNRAGTTGGPHLAGYMPPFQDSLYRRWQYRQPACYISINFDVRKVSKILEDFAMAEVQENGQEAFRRSLYDLLWKTRQ